MNTIILDGGAGQELVRRSSRPLSPLWSSEVLMHEPDIVTALHADYIAAGADVITQATYSATPERLSRDGVADWFDTLQAAGAMCATRARAASERSDVRIAACLPPLVASYWAETVPDEAQAVASYRRIVAAQVEHTDLMLCETMASIAEARYAATAALESGLPVWVAFTVDDEIQEGRPARLRSGEPVAEAVDQIGAMGVDALMLNCSSPEACSHALPAFKSASVSVGVYANAFVSVEALQPGGTVNVLRARNDLGPEAYADFAAQWSSQGATIIGGCCETAPAHIAALARRLRDPVA